MIEQKVKGTIIRSKARWVEYGATNTRYFLNLEKRRGEKKNINKLKLKDGTERPGSHPKGRRKIL